MANIYTQSFEVSQDFTPGANSPVLAISTGYANTGMQSLSVSVATSATTEIRRNGAITIEPNTSYDISFWSAANASFSGQVLVNQQTSTGSYINTLAKSTTFGGVTARRVVTLSTGSTTGRIELAFNIYNLTAGTTLYFDDISIDSVTANITPVANAGVDQTVIVGNEVTLSGTGTDSDGTVSSYDWSLSSIPLGSAAALQGMGAIRTFIPDVVGSYIATLRVTDSDGAMSAADSVAVMAELATSGPTIRIRSADGTSWERRKLLKRSIDNSAWVWSGSAAATTAPGMPTSITVSQTTDTATINWAEPTSDGGSAVTGYRIVRDGVDNNGSGAYSTIVSATSRTFTMLNLASATTYSLSVSAVNAAGEGMAVTQSVTTEGSAETSVRPKIGVYRSYQTSAIELAAYEQFLGRQVNYVLEFQGTESQTNLTWPNYMRNHYTTTFMGVRRLMLGASLSSTRMNGPDDYYSRIYSWQELADGVFDSMWAQLAQNLVNSGQGDCIVRGAHEFNEPMFTHRVYPGEEAAFIAAWRRWHGILRANGFSGYFNWNPTTGDYNGNNLDTAACYPGDAYVDTIDLDLYDRWYSRGATPQSPRTLAEQEEKWNQMLTMNTATWRGLNYWRQFAVSHGKGIGFSEWGTGSYFNDSDGNHGGGDNEVFMNGMCDFILDQNYPAGSPGGVVDHAFWEDGIQGIMPVTAENPDQGRPIPVPKMRAIFKARMCGA